MRPTATGATQAILVVLLLVLLVEREVVRARWAYRVKASVLGAALPPLWLAFAVVVAVRGAGWLR